MEIIHLFKGSDPEAEYELGILKTLSFSAIYSEHTHA